MSLEKSRAAAPTFREGPDHSLEDAKKIQVAQLLSAELMPITGNTELSLNPSRSLGSKDSAHDVFFIQGENPDGEGLTLACKPFQSDKGARALNELEAIRRAKDMGFLTFTPVGKGVYTFSGLGHILVTEHMPRLNTMNFLGWRNYKIGHENYDRMVADPLEGISTFAGKIHSAGITHGDYQLKNNGLASAGQFMLFDLENAIFWDPEDLSNNQEFLKEAASDIGNLIKSLVYRGFNWQASEKVFNEEIEKLIFDPYLEIMGEHIDSANFIDMLSSKLDVEMRRNDLRWGFASRDGLPS